ncbi:hypothetical protein WH52_13310 [Tenacibaculum holothuriorum]|uniref:histidine kinase n=1 Tax=Tenacibaculum holothuriorum TaxID=1635173 RepID=A0A1Y2PBG4_9FLAO|nr:ATP-binding protein [Tenacibaculum holothuriorum]OSY87038.1 hypothetical protein WH52_13310 [Tenacibaculum holothuriorum]
MRLYFFLFITLTTLFSFSQHDKNKVKHDSILFSQKINKALFFLNSNQFDSFKKHTYFALPFAKSSKEIEKCHFFLAYYYNHKHISDSAYHYYHASKNLLLKIGDTLTAGRRLADIADIQYRANDYLGSEINTILALKYIENSKLSLKKYSLYNLLGNIYCDRKEPEEALKYYDLSITFLSQKQKKHDLEIIRVINNKGLALQRVNRNKEAIKYFKKGLKYDSIQQKYPKQYALLIENIAWSNFSLKNYRNVLNQYNEALKINTSIKDLLGIIRNHINISHFHKENNNLSKAKEHAKNALGLTQNTHFEKEELLALELLAELSPKKESIKYLKEYTEKKDRAIQKERVLKNQFAKVRYETEKKEKENTILKTDNEKKQAEITYQKQQKTIGWLAAFIGILLFGLSISFFSLRRRKLIYQAQLQKIEAREHERQQIAKSLHDEVAGDLRLIHQKLEGSNLLEEAQKLNTVKDNVRNLSHQLSSVSFDKVPFKDQIINLVSDYFTLDFRIKVNGVNDIEWTKINNSIKRLLYLSIRECIQNTQKHAEANLITIDFSVHKKSVFLNITDNGKGFDINNSKKGIGLHNMQERVEELNGTLTIESEVGKGTKTHIQIPLNV